LRNCIKIEQITDTVKPVETVLSRCRREKLMELYKIPIYHDVKEFLSLIAHKRGKLGKGGVPEYEAAARTVLQDWNSGKIAFYTEPPKEKRGTHVAVTIVTQFAQEIKLDEIFLNEESTVLSGLREGDNGRFMSMGTGVFSSTVDTGLMAHLGSSDAGDMEDMEEEEIPETRYMVRGDEHEHDDDDAAEENMIGDEDEDDYDNGFDQSSSSFLQQSKLRDEEDMINPQLHKERKKQYKMMKKLKKKQGRSSTFEANKTSQETMDEEEAERPRLFAPAAPFASSQPPPLGFAATSTATTTTTNTGSLQDLVQRLGQFTPQSLSSSHWPS